MAKKEISKRKTKPSREGSSQKSGIQKLSKTKPPRKNRK